MKGAVIGGILLTGKTPSLPGTSQPQASPLEALIDKKTKNAW